MGCKQTRERDEPQVCQGANTRPPAAVEEKASWTGHGDQVLWLLQHLAQECINYKMESKIRQKYQKVLSVLYVNAKHRNPLSAKKRRGARFLSTPTPSAREAVCPWCPQQVRLGGEVGAGLWVLLLLFWGNLLKVSIPWTGRTLRINGAWQLGFGGCSLEANWLYAVCPTASSPQPSHEQGAALGWVLRNKDRNRSSLGFAFHGAKAVHRHLWVSSWAVPLNS